MVQGGHSRHADAPRSDFRIQSQPVNQRRSRSPREQIVPSSDLRRSQRLEDRQSFHSTENQEPSRFDRPSIAPLLHHEAVGKLGLSDEGAKAISESSLPEIPPRGTVVVSLDRRPPLEVRTSVSIPRITVRVTISDLEPLVPANIDPNMDFGTLHAVVSLWSADGQVASPHAMPPMLTGRKDATLANVVSTNGFERRAEATFSDLAITWPGHYRIRISIMETPLPGRDEDSEHSIGSPRQLISIETRPIHAHGFAPLGSTIA